MKRWRSEGFEVTHNAGDDTFTMRVPRRKLTRYEPNGTGDMLHEASFDPLLDEFLGKSGNGRSRRDEAHRR